MSFYPSQQPDPNEDMMMDHNQYQMYQQQNSQPMPQQLQIPMAGQIPQYSQFAPEHLFQQQQQQQGSEGFDGMNFVPPSQFNDFSNGALVAIHNMNNSFFNNNSSNHSHSINQNFNSQILE